MTTVIGLISTLKTKGVRLSIDNDRLSIDAPKGVLMPEDIEGIRRQKSEILAFLREIATQAEIPPLRRYPHDRSAPLSFSQQRLWFIDQLEPGNFAYNMPGAVRLRGMLNQRSLQRALDTVVERHEILRTRFAVVDDEAVQIVAPDAKFDLRPLDLASLDAQQREAAIRQATFEETREPFELRNGPPIRGRLLRLSDEDHVLLITMHHIVSDGWSLGVLVQEIAALYAAYQRNAANPLPPLPIQYSDYARWQREWLQAEVLQRQIDHWREHLQGAPALLELPTDRARPAVQDYRGGKVAVVLEAELTSALKDLAARFDATLFMTLFAGFAILLSRLSRQSDLVVGVPVANRQRLELEGLMGFFVNTLALRARLNDELSVGEFLERVNETILAAFNRQEVPFEKIVEALQPQRSLSYNPIYQVVFALQNGAQGALELPGLTLMPQEMPSLVAQFDLSLTLQESAERIVGNLGYASELFDRGTVERWSDNFRCLLEQMAAHPDKKLGELVLLSASQRRQIISEYNATHIEYPRQASINDLFEAQVENHAAALALIGDGELLTYRELNRRANRLAHYLRMHRVGFEDRVAIVMPRCVQMLVCQLAILKCGAAYVPIDPELPEERKLFLLRDCAAATALALQSEPSIQGGLALRWIDPVQVCAQIGKCPDGNLGLRNDAQGAAYVMYTSGSTGTPKGVVVSHRNVNRLIVNNTFAPIVAADCIAYCSNPAFDASTFEIWAALLQGARLVVVPHTTLLEPSEFSRLLLEHEVSVLHLTTGLFNQYAELLKEVFGRVRYLLFGGEAADLNVVRKVLGAGYSARLIHLYGPTETTAFASSMVVESVADNARSIPIGRPISNTQVYVLDACLQPIPIGVWGEIYVGGDGVSRGYLNRAGLTAERFVADPFSTRAGQRMYRTGDLGRWRADGTIEYLGRNDHQVKVRGFRIELGEIEAQLGSHAQVKEAVVVARDEGGEKRLVAYLVPISEELEIESLKGYLRSRMPEYMVPSAYVVLPRLPLTPNGKVDRKALPAPQENAYGVGTYEAPRGEIEPILAGIWRELLHVERIGRQDNFFELGGHSLLAVRMTARIEQLLNRQLQLREVFASGSLALLAQRVREAGGNVLPPIEVADRSGLLLLSFAQQRLWFIEQLQNVGAAYHMPMALRLHGELDETALRRALDRVIERHEMLRTRFVQVEGEPRQQIEVAQGFALGMQDLQSMELEAREQQVSVLARQEAIERFDLQHGPLIRGRLLKLGAQEQVLLVTMHHIVSDGWSMGVLLSEVATLYSAYSEGQADPLPALRIQYADYALWQRGWLQGAVLEEQLQYWREQLKGATPVELPLDMPRPPMRTYRGETYRFSVPAELTEKLRDVSRAQGATLYMTLLAGFQLLLSRITGQQDILVATPAAGRDRPEIEGLIGFFVNMLFMRTRLEHEWSFERLLRQVRQDALGAYAHQELPFDTLVARLRTEGAESSLARIGFTVQNASLETGELPEDAPALAGLRIESLGQSATTAKTDVLLTLVETPQGLSGDLQYAADLFHADTMQRLSERFVRVMEQVAARPKVSLAELDLTLPQSQSDIARPSTNQQMMWTDQLLHAERASYYNIIEYVEFQGRIDPLLFKQAVQHVVDCATSLRLQFARAATGLLDQQLLSHRAVEVSLLDYSQLENPQAAAHAWMEEHRRRYIDPTTQPPFRFAVLRLSDERHYWYYHLHHLITDGMSLALLRERVSQVYRALANGEQLQIDTDAQAYAEYLHRDTEYRYSPQYMADRSYWSTQAGASCPVTLSVRSDAGRSAEAMRIRRQIDPEVARSLKQRAQQSKISFSRYMITLAVVYLHKMTGETRLSVGLPTHGRFDATAYNLLAACTNIAPLRLVVDPQASIDDFAAHVSEQVQSALRHGRHSYEEVRRLLSGRSQDTQLFNAAINVLPGQLQPVDLATASGLTKSYQKHEKDLLILLMFSKDPGDLAVTFYGNPQRYEHWELERHLQRFAELLEEIAARSEASTIAELPVLNAMEREQLLQSFNASDAAVEGGRIHELFETQVARNADAVAVSDGVQQLSYAELNERSNQLAHYLRGLGVRPDELVGICVDRSVEMVVGILGILKCGAAYVPLDPGYPAERLQYMVSESAARVVLTQGKHQNVLGNVEQLVVLDAQWSEIAGSLKSNPDRVGLSDEELAYVIYTSGSTGRAKGTCVTHAGVRNLLQWYMKQFEFGAQDKVLVVSSFSFDLTQKNFFACLLSGGQLHLGGEPFDPRGISGQIEREAITTLNLTPSAFYALLEVQGSGYEQLRSLRRVFLGGEPINVQRLVGLGRAQPQVQLINSYGPTECTDVVSYHCLGEGWQDSTGVPIGGPIWNTQLYVVDTTLSPVPLGAVGEICIAGAGVSRGYLNRAGLTAERFVADPFSPQTGQRMYRTGDLGRWRADGTIEYLGRNDHQVKVRGFRIELGEIEAQLGSHAQVKEAVVVAREEAAGEKRLVAYLVPTSEEIEIEQLKGYLRSRMPEYMIPNAYVVLPQLPLTPNGKVDRKALPAPESAGAGQRQYEAPQGAVEERLSQIWQELLHVERIGRHDNFFELGGHSLLIVKMIERLRGLGIMAEVGSVFTMPTLEALARSLQSEEPAAQIEAPPNLIPPDADRITPQMLTLIELDQQQIDLIVQHIPGGARNIQDVYPLAPLQEGILFHHLMNPQADAYVLPMLLAFDSRQQLDALLAALQTVIGRHDILRTAILWEKFPKPIQVVCRHATLAVRRIELDSQQDALAQLNAKMSTERVAMELDRAPMMHAEIALDERTSQWFLLLRMHHLVCDHIGSAVVIAEVRSLLAGRAHELVEPVAYRGFVARALAQSGQEETTAFFRSRLADVDEATAPFGLLNVHGDGGGIDEARELMEPALAQRVRHHSRRLNVSSAAVFHAAYALVVARTSARDDVVFGSVLSGRMQSAAGADRVLGMFINTLPVRLSLKGMDVRQLIEHTQRELVELLKYEQASLAEAQRCSGISDGTPLFSAVLNYRHSVRAADASGGPDASTSGIRMMATVERTNYPFVVSVDDLGEAFGITAQTDPRIDPHRVNGYLHAAVQSILEALEQAPRTLALTLSVLPESERHQVLELFNATQMAGPQTKLMHQLFEEQVERTPAAVAVICGDRQLTYEQLNRRANQLAHALLVRGVRPDDRVAFYLERSVEMVVGLLGILKAGGAYVPLDVSYPAERLTYMLQDAAPRVVLTQERLARSLPANSAQVIRLDADANEFDRQSDANISAADFGLTPQHLAYVIYTSGSTGLPKGVMVEHRNLVNLARWHCAAFDVREGSRSSCVAALGFDATVWEVWPPLSVGATLVLAPPEVINDVEALITWWASQPLDVSFLPTPMAEFVFSGNIRNPTLRTLLVGGDRLRHRPVSESFSLVNNYGPTECTVVATSGRIDDEDAVLHIGRPIANAQIYILDSRQQPVPIGVSGEIYIGGAGVARGYLNRPELTAERFLRDPFSTDPQARMYRAGDLGRWRSDGTIEYLGRNDDQVKIRGFRIELGEIETQLAHHEQVKDAVVMVREDVPGEKRLVAYVVPDDSAAARAPNAEALREHLKTVLPEYMVPSALIMMQSLPLTPHGKLDRRALPAPELGAYATQQYEAPQGEVEQKLAEIWQELLGIERVGRQDNFFELGGHSLLAVRMTARIEQLLNRQLQLREVFASSSFASLAQRVREAGGNVLPPIEVADRSGLLLLSFAQQRLWFIEQLQNVGAAYHMPMALRLHGELDETALRRALDRVIERHEMLRTRFVQVEGEPRQQIEAAQGFALGMQDLQSMELEAREQQVSVLARQEAIERFDLQHGPLIRGRLLKLGPQEQVLLVTMHHIVSDGWSMGVLLSEVATLYSAYSEGRTDPLPALPIQYADYALWQRGRLQGAVLEEQLQYWREQLKGATPVELPLDMPRAALRSYAGKAHRFTLSQELTQGLRALSQAQGATLYMTLLGAFQLLLSRVSGQQDVVVVTPAAGRDRQETEGLIGFFINMLFMRMQVQEQESFEQLLRRVKASALGAYAHQELPFDTLVAQLRTEGASLSLARVGFTLQNASLETGELPEDAPQLPGLRLEPLGQSAAAAKTDVLLTLVENAQGLSADLQYAVELFNPQTMQQLAERFVRLIEQIVARPGLPVRQLDLRLPQIPADTLPRPSVNQQMMWLDQLIYPQRASYYNIVEYVEFTGRFDAERFAQAAQHVVDTTTVLRLQFSTTQMSVLGQQLLESRRLEMPFIDFSSQPDPAAAAQAWVNERRRQHIDPSREVAFRYAVLKLAEDRHYWYTHYHHLIMDGASLLLIRQRIGNAYRALVQGAQLPGITDAASYDEYLHRDAEYRYSPQYLQDHEYWLQQSALHAPVTLSVRNYQQHNAEPIRVRRELAVEVVRKLHEQAKRAGLSVSRYMIALSVVYLHKMTGETRLSVGMPSHGRFDEVARNLIASCTNISALNFSLDPQAGVDDFAAHVSEQVSAALEHGRFSYEEIRRLVAGQSPDAVPFSVTVNMMPNQLRPPELEGAVGRIQPFPRHENDLLIIVAISKEPTAMPLAFYGNPQRYEQWELERHLQRFAELLEEIAARSEASTIAELPVLNATEREQLLQSFNASDAAVEGGRIHELFEAQVARNADAVAVSDGVQQLSYAELNERSNQLAHYLRGLGVRPDELVGICVDRSVEMVVGILGILKAGAAYVPLDPGYPAERLQYMVSESAARVVLTQGKHQNVLGNVEQLVVLDAQWSEIAGSSKSNPLRVGLSDEELAYVIYTSGSTGRAKGTCVTHAGVRNLLQWYVKQFEFGAQDKVLVVSSFSFDLTQKNFFACLLSGGQLHLGGEPFDPRGISGQIEREAITTLNLTPSAFYALLEVQGSGYEQLRSLRRVFLGGEPINVQRLLGLGRAQPQVQLINSYGPTECTDVVSYQRFSEGWQDSTGVPIGGPIWNTQLYIVDASLEPVPLGAVGEICIAGAGVSRGYLNRAGLTAERFVADPFSARAGQRMYRTGDLGRWRADGTIEYLGRNDHQVKVRGFRIELGEIEAQLGSHAQVKEAVVVAREEAAGEKRLVAYLVPTSEELEIESLKGYLRSRMPEYMIPNAYVVLPQLPLTPNGKVDRKALPAPESAGAGQRQYEAPQGAVEERLAQIWQELLHVERIGRHDNFFELGGHSLLSVMLQNRLKNIGIEISLAALFQYSSIARLAELADAKSGSTPNSKLIALQSTGSDTPLFMLHDVTGEISHYRDLSGFLSAGAPVYGVPLVEASSSSSLEALAARHVETLRAQQPSGPYRLAGHSVGGLLAYEMASQLLGAGEQMDFVGLIDTHCPSPALANLEPISEMEALFLCLRQRFVAIEEATLKELAGAKDIATVLQLSKERRLLPQELSLELLQTWTRNCMTAVNAARAYRPASLATHVHLFTAQTRNGMDPARGWSRVVGTSLHVEEIGGTHMSMLQPPYAQRLGTAMTRILAQPRNHPQNHQER